MSAPRVLFVVHHALDPNAGVSGATMQLAAALRARGATTEFFSFDDAFDTPAGSSTAPSTSSCGSRRRLT